MQRKNRIGSTGVGPEIVENDGHAGSAWTWCVRRVGAAPFFGSGLIPYRCVRSGFRSITPGDKKSECGQETNEGECRDPPNFETSAFHEWTKQLS